MMTELEGALMEGKAQQKIVLVGPAYGYPHRNVVTFKHAEEQLVRVGYSVINLNRPDDDWEMLDRLRVIRVAESDGVAIIDGWGASADARLLVQVANALLIPVLPLGLWVSKAKQGWGTDFPPALDDWNSPEDAVYDSW